jgi:hypothetical protein
MEQTEQVEHFDSQLVNTGKILAVFKQKLNKFIVNYLVFSDLLNYDFCSTFEKVEQNGAAKNELF